MMFDIDNTLEFSSRSDNDTKGDGPPITPTVDFVKKWSKEGVRCYFVTGREPNKVEAQATEKWLKNTFGLTDSELEQRVFFLGDLIMSSLDSSNVPPNTEIAYKDVARQALSERDGAFWLMSMGDQSTDSYGQHGGARILIPNLLFNKAILFNNPSNPGFTRMQVLAPTQSQYLQLKNSILKSTDLSSALKSQ
jgi:hypothetical protein